MDLLSLQDVDCGPGRVLTSFDLEVNPAILSQRYVYDCCRPDPRSITLLNCEVNLTTTKNLGGGWYLRYLDRQNVQCPQGQVLQRLRLNTEHGDGDMSYDFRCCGFERA